MFVGSSVALVEIRLSLVSLCRRSIARDIPSQMLTGTMLIM